MFLYRRVLGKELGILEAVRAQRPARLPTVLGRDEVRRLLAQLDGLALLVATLLYGSGARLLEWLRLRVKDVDFERNEITVRDGKRQKDRVTLLPASAKQSLLEHLAKRRELYLADLRRGLGRAPLPFALARKHPNADSEWPWQYIFGASSHYVDRRTGIRHRHHLHESVIQKYAHEGREHDRQREPAGHHATVCRAGESTAAHKQMHQRTDQGPERYANRFEEKKKQQDKQVSDPHWNRGADRRHGRLACETEDHGE